METNSHVPEPPLEYRVRWGNVLLAIVASCGVLAALFAPGPDDGASTATSEITRSGPTSLVAQIEPSLNEARRARPKKQANEQPPRRRRQGGTRAKRPASAERIAPPRAAPAAPQGSPPSDPLASEFGL